MVTRCLSLLILIISIQNLQSVSDTVFDGRFLLLLKSLFPSQDALFSICKESKKTELIEYITLSESGVGSKVTEEQFYQHLAELCNEGKKNDLFANIEQQTLYLTDKVKPRCATNKVYSEVVDARIKTFNALLENLKTDYPDSVEQSSKMGLASECSRRIEKVLLIESDGRYRSLYDLLSLMAGVVINQLGYSGERMKPGEPIVSEGENPSSKGGRGFLSSFLPG